MQRPHGFVVLQEVGKIWRATSKQGSKFKPYMPFVCVSIQYLASSMMQFRSIIAFTASAAVALLSWPVCGRLRCSNFVTTYGLLSCLFHVVVII